VGEFNIEEFESVQWISLESFSVVGQGDDVNPTGVGMGYQGG